MTTPLLLPRLAARVRRVVAITLTLGSTLLASNAVAQGPGPSATTREAPPSIAREFRGAWVASVANIDWPSKPGLSSWQQQAELIAMLDRARELRLNAILLQVRPAADALYDSPYEPWSAYLTGMEGRAPEPYYDPLTFAVREAHARGLELHAWFNPYRARHPSATTPNARTHISSTHPSWVKSYGKYLWMDPGEPGVLAHSLRVIIDVVKRYDIDGIHVDDYFYPYPEADANKVEVPFPDSGSYARYQAKGGTLGRSDWRRYNVDQFVEQLYTRTKAAKPWVKVGISPFGIWRPGYPASIQGFDSYEKLAGDSKKWLNEGWVDYFTPQLYWPIAQTPQSYTTLLGWWVSENTKARHMWIGHNSSRAAAGGTWLPDELNNQVRATRATTAAGQGATGDIFFSMRSLMPVQGAARAPESVGVLTQPPAPAAAAAMAERLVTELYQDAVLVPASPWLGRTRPAAPTARVRRVSATGDVQVDITPGPRARWSTVRVLRDGAWRTWVLPSSFTRLTIGDANASIPSRVVVTAVDRNGNESRVVELSVAGLGAR